MARWFSTIRRFLPRRRRRDWRYVSLRRRGASLLVFSLLVLVVYGYAWMTDDARVKSEAIRYLSQLTGGRAKIAKAHFSIFGGIRLEDLRLYLDEGNQPPFFEAAQVLMNHRLGALLHGRIEPTEITCFKPHIRLIENVRTQQWNVKQVFPLAEHGPTHGLTDVARLPAIRLREGELELLDADEEGNLLPVAKSPLPVVVTLLPEKNRVYQVSFEGGEGAISGRGTIDPRSGQTDLTGSLGLEGLDRALPRRYRMWRQQYKLSGQVDLTAQAHISGASAATGAVEQMTAILKGVSMELPPQQGALRLANVQGRVIFRGNTMILDKITGRIEQAPQALVTMNGLADGYGPDGTFDLHIQVQDLLLPLQDLPVEVPWSAQINDLMHRVEPLGKVDLLADVSRDSQGTIHTRLLTKLKGVSAKAPDRPLRVEGLTGEVVLTERRIELHDVRGTHQQARITLNGWGEGLGDEARGDLVVSIADMPLTPAIHDAMPAELRSRWDDLSPCGAVDCTLHVSRARPTGAANVVASVQLTGKASIAHKSFPYRLEALTGQVDVDEKQATIRNVRGKAGPMTARVNGYVAAHDWDISVDANDVPLDDTLMAALPRSAQDPFAACGLKGLASVTGGRIRHRPGEPVDYLLPVAFKGASLSHNWMPYRLDELIGKVRIDRTGLQIQDLSGRHGEAQVHLAGHVLWGEPANAPHDASHRDLEITATATDLALDESFRQALPPASKTAWEDLSPGGLTDADFSFWRDSLDGPTGYRLILRPRGATIRYKHFPYPLRDIQGRTVIESGRVQLEEISAQAGPATLKARGEIRLGENEQWADLELHSGAIPVDAELLAALPKALVTSLGMRGGGTISVDLDHLQLRRQGQSGPWLDFIGPTTAPSSQPQSAPVEKLAEAAKPTALPMDVSPSHSSAMLAPSNTSSAALADADDSAASAEPATEPSTTMPASRPSDSPAWRWQGHFRANNVIMAVGIDAKSVTGTIAGQMSCDGPVEHLSADAALNLERVSVGPRNLQNLQTRLIKLADSPLLRVDRFTGRAYGGTLTGRAEIRLGRKIRYGLSLAVENADLRQFLAGAHPEGPVDASGELAGNLQLSGTMNDPDSRRGAGRIHVENAHMFRLPVMLGFLNVLSLGLPGNAPFTMAEVDYTLRGPVLTFQEIYLQGPTSSLLGAGTLDTQSEALHLTFLSGPPGRLPRLAGLTDIIEHLAGEVMSIRVTGTINKPRTQTGSLRNLRETLQELMQPE